MRDRGDPRRWAVFGASAAVSGILFIDLCNAVFQCGCRSLWSGVAAACNIHHAAPPHCPWCEHPMAGGLVAFGAVALAQAAAAFWPGRLGLGPRMGLAVAALPVVGGVTGWLQGLLFSYWM